MRNRSCSMLAGLLVLCVIRTPASAGVAPYVRLDYGGHQLRMAEGNALIRRIEASFQADGLPASFKEIGPAYGPGASAGLWLFPCLRVGGTYSYQRSVRENHLHVPGLMFFADDVDFRITEIGGEAAVRIERWRGLTVGGSVARGRAEMIEGYTAEDFSAQYYQDAVAERTRTTYGAYLGIDQTNPGGVAGYLRVGYQFRDMGSMPSRLTISDGTTTYQTTGNTIGLDYSGVYLKVGIGYDLGR